MLKSQGVQCQKCDKTFKSEPKLDLHIQFDHTENEKAVSCQKCNFLFQTHEEQDLSRKCSAWKDFRFTPLSFQFPPRDRIKCGGLV